MSRRKKRRDEKKRGREIGGGSEGRGVGRKGIRERGRGT